MAIDLEATYRDLHEHPELSFQEHRTAGIVAGHLRRLHLVVHEGIGGTGVVGVLANGAGPTVLLRADMDGLPVREETGLPYASTARATDHDGQDVPVMHACGHDVHVTALLGAVERLVSGKSSWTGTLIAVFQPAEERGGGARAMVQDGLFQKVPVPDVVLGQHVAPFPAGWVGVHSGAAMASADSLTVTLHGVGGHGSRPEATIDPVLMAAATTLRLNTIVSRELSATSSAVLTVGQLHAGTKHNVIPNHATLGISLRAFDESVRTRILTAIDRVVRGEAAASGAVRDPEIVHDDHFPVTVNDADATERTRAGSSARARSSIPAMSPAARTSGSSPPPPGHRWSTGSSAAPTHNSSPESPTRWRWPPGCRPTTRRGSPRPSGRPWTTGWPPWSLQPASGSGRPGPKTTPGGVR